MSTSMCNATASCAFKLISDKTTHIAQYRVLYLTEADLNIENLLKNFKIIVNKLF